MPLNDFCRELLSVCSPVTLTGDVLDEFDKLYDRVQEINHVMNITALQDMCDITLKHFVDSLSLLSVKQFCDAASKGATICDIGCGGGFPGLPIKIALKNAKITMIDSTEKKVKSIEETAKILGLSQMRFVASRAEELTRIKRDEKNLRESFDFATARAVARLHVLCELCLPFVKVGGYFLAMKGAAAETELSEARNAITMLGGKIESLIPIELDADDILKNVTQLETNGEILKFIDFCRAKRYIIIIKKIKSTPSSYPRQYAAITRSPL